MEPVGGGMAVVVENTGDSSVVVVLIWISPRHVGFAADI